MVCEEGKLLRDESIKSASPFNLQYNCQVVFKKKKKKIYLMRFTFRAILLQSRRCHGPTLSKALAFMESLHISAEIFKQITIKVFTY